MKSKILFALLASSLLFSCKTPPTPATAVEYFIYGEFHCHCIAPQCAKLYKYTPGSVLTGKGAHCEMDDFTYEGESLPATDIAKAEALLAAVPAELYSSEETTFGCPDCADQGGYYISVKKDGEVKTWRIDTQDQSLPAFLLPFHQKLIETFEQL